MLPEYTVRLEEWTQAGLEDLAYDLDLEEIPSEQWDYYLTFADETFVDHVEKYLPKRNIRSAIHIGKDFHGCGIGFESKYAAEHAAHMNVVDLMCRLDKVGHPWSTEA